MLDLDLKPTDPFSVFDVQKEKDNFAKPPAQEQISFSLIDLETPQEDPNYHGVYDLMMNSKKQVSEDVEAPVQVDFFDDSSLDQVPTTAKINVRKSNLSEIDLQMMVSLR